MYICYYMYTYIYIYIYIHIYMYYHTYTSARAPLRQPWEPLAWALLGKHVPERLVQALELYVSLVV